METIVTENRIKELKELIEYHNKAYYAEANPEVSDEVFDALVDELNSLEELNPSLLTAESPTQNVGGSYTDDFPLQRHRYKMLSLEKGHTIKKVDNFIMRLTKLVGHGDSVYICQPKYDGVALSLVYEYGTLISAVTRGNGKDGDDVINNALMIKDIVRNLPVEFSDRVIEVRGEVYISKANLSILNERMVLENQPLFKTARNTAAGTLKLKNSYAVKDRNLSFMAYQLIDNDNGNTMDRENLHQLEIMGYPIDRNSRQCINREEIKTYIYDMEKVKDSLPYDIDGVVIKVDNISYRKKLGKTSAFPKWAMAYKFASKEVETTLRSVVWHVGKTGNITPVAQMDAALIGGTVIKKASLYGDHEIIKLNLHYGDSVILIRSGEVMPKIVRAIPEKRKEDAQKVWIPTHCPACGSRLESDADYKGLFCINDNECTGIKSAKLKFFVGRECMNILGLGEQLMSHLIDTDVVTSFVDLYELTSDKIKHLESQFRMSSDKVIRSIEKSKETHYQNVFYSLGIRSVGLTTARKLTTDFPDIDKLIEADRNKLESTKSISTTAVDNILEYFSNTKNVDTIHRLRKLGLNFSN